MKGARLTVCTKAVDAAYIGEGCSALVVQSQAALGPGRAAAAGAVPVPQRALVLVKRRAGEPGLLRTGRSVPARHAVRALEADSARHGNQQGSVHGGLL